MEVEFIKGNPPPTERDLAEIRIMRFCEELKKRPGLWAKLPEDISPHDAEMFFRNSTLYQSKYAGDKNWYVRQR